MRQREVEVKKEIVMKSSVLLAASFQLRLNRSSHNFIAIQIFYLNI